MRFQPLGSATNLMSANFKTPKLALASLIRRAMGSKRLIRLWRESRKGIGPRAADCHLVRLPSSGEDGGMCLFHAPSGWVIPLPPIDADLFPLATCEDGDAERVIAGMRRKYSADELTEAFQHREALAALVKASEKVDSSIREINASEH